MIVGIEIVENFSPLTLAGCHWQLVCQCSWQKGWIPNVAAALSGLSLLQGASMVGDEH